MTRETMRFVFGALLFACALPAVAKPPKTDVPPPQVQAEIDAQKKLTGGASAQTQQKRPETCEEQCEFISKTCTDPCKSLKGKPAAKAHCEDRCGQMSAVCSGSCREKGKIDKQYMTDHLKFPKQGGGAAPAPSGEGSSSGSGEGE